MPFVCIARVIWNNHPRVGNCSGLGLDGAVAHAPSSDRCLFSSFAQHGDNHRAFTGSNIAFDVKDLLPSAEHGLAITHGYRQARSEQRRLQVGMAIAVVPSSLVGVVPIWRNEAP